MKFIIPILILINLSCFAQDTLPMFRNSYYNYLIEKEITCCKSAKNQLNCVDSLIQVTLINTDYSGKGNYPKTYFNRYKKLLLFHFYAGNISGLRGDLEQSFAYYAQMEVYLDTLMKNGKEEDFRDLAKITHYQKTEFCAKTYLKDTTLFNRCNCMQFFPKNYDESLRIDTASSLKENQKTVVKYPNWGNFYIHDTLRINKHFVSDSASIVYFKQILIPLIQTKLIQNPSYFEMLGDPNMHINRDTIIYKLSTEYKKNKHERKCELVFSTSQHPEKFDYLLSLIANMELPGSIKHLEIYIPIVFTTEKSINSNSVGVFDDHFLMEIRKIPRINPK